MFRRRSPRITQSEAHQRLEEFEDGPGERIRRFSTEEILGMARDVRTAAQLNCFNVLDYISSYEDDMSVESRLEKLYGHIDEFGRPSLSTFEQIKRRLMEGLNPRLWIFVAIVAAVSAFTAYAVDWSVDVIFALRVNWSTKFNPALGILIWIVSAMFLAFLSECCCVFISPESKKSGIAELKSILSGAMLTRFLSLRALISKFFGLILALGGGLSFGKEGPFVHMGAIFAHQLSKLSIFQAIHRSVGTYREVLSAAVAAGVTSTFGTPLGGALFSIEVTSTFLTVPSLWTIFWSSCMTYLWFTAFHSLDFVTLFRKSVLPEFSISWEILSFVILGIFCGFCSAFFVRMSASIMLFLNTTKRYSWIYRGKFKTVAWVSCITALGTFQLFRAQDHEITNAMFQLGNLAQEWSKPHWSITLFGYIFYKTIFTAVALSLPIPAGVYTPIFATGSLMGRFYGELTGLFFHSVKPGAYAVAGAAAFASGCTRTIASAVIVFEVTGQLEYLLPVLISVLLSYTVSKAFSVSVYDLTLRIGAFPYVPFAEIQTCRKIAEDVMKTEIHFLSSHSTYKDLQSALDESDLNHIPVVKSTEDRSLVGSISRRALETFIDLHGPHTEAMIQGDGHIEEISVKGIESDKNTLADQTLSVTEEILKESIDDSLLSTGETRRWKETRIDFDKLLAHVNGAPLFISPHTPMPKVHYLFTMLRLTQVYIVSEDKLVGIITLHELTAA